VTVAVMVLVMVAVAMAVPWLCVVQRKSVVAHGQSVWAKIWVYIEVLV